MSNASAKKRGLPKRVRMRHDSHFVDELTTRNEEEAVGKRVALTAIIPDPDQPRTTMGDLKELATSIGDKGVLEPILVRPMPTGVELPASAPNAQYMIISGERRYRASMQAGLEDVPVIVMDVDAEEALEIALIENLQRKDLTPFEEGEGYKSLADRFGYTHEEIAKAVGKSRTVVTESLALLVIPHRVREAAQALGIQTKSILVEILKAESDDEMIRLLEQVSRHGMSRDDLRRQTRTDKTKSGAPRKRPFVFQFKPDDKSFSLSLKFRQSSVSHGELVNALQAILEDLKRNPETSL